MSNSMQPNPGQKVSLVNNLNRGINWEGRVMMSDRLKKNTESHLQPGCLQETLRINNQHFLYNIYICKTSSYTVTHDYTSL